MTVSYFYFGAYVSMTCRRDQEERLINWHQSTPYWIYLWKIVSSAIIPMNSQLLMRCCILLEAIVHLFSTCRTNLPSKESKYLHYVMQRLSTAATWRFIVENSRQDPMTWETLLPILWRDACLLLRTATKMWQLIIGTQTSHSCFICWKRKQPYWEQWRKINVKLHPNFCLQ